LEPFTLVGATTRIGLLTSPLRDRFGVICRLDFYSPHDLAAIVSRAAGVFKIEITREGALEIGRRSRGTPRIANRLLRRVRDFAQMAEKKGIDAETASEALDRMDVDPLGLDQMDRRILECIIDQFSGGPVGVKTLAVACSEEVRTLEDIYEPYLIQCGFLKRTARGRVVTPRAYNHIKVKKKYTDMKA
ncbi:MAG: Holliday junction DNA helicase RuvB C-terminal domain-containing protein, partial [Desulfonatronovibrionaceae bacterium]